MAITREVEAKLGAWRRKRAREEAGLPEETDRYPREQPTSFPEQHNFGFSGQPNGGLSDQPMFGFPGQPTFRFPEQPKIGFSEQANFGFPGQPKFGFPGQPKFGFPEQPKLDFPGQPKFGFPEQPMGYPKQHKGHPKQPKSYSKQPKGCPTQPNGCLKQPNGLPDSSASTSWGGRGGRGGVNAASPSQARGGSGSKLCTWPEVFNAPVRKRLPGEICDRPRLRLASSSGRAGSGGKCIDREFVESEKRPEHWEAPWMVGLVDASNRAAAAGRPGFDGGSGAGRLETTIVGGGDTAFSDLHHEILRFSEYVSLTPAEVRLRWWP